MNRCVLKEHIWFWFCCVHQLKTVTVAIAAPVELFCKNNKSNCSVGQESLSRKARGGKKTFSSLNLSSFHKNTGVVFMCSNQSGLACIILFQIPHTFSQPLGRVPDGRTTPGCSVAKSAIHHELSLQLWDCTSSRSLPQLSGAHYIQSTNIIFLQTAKTGRDNLPVFLGRRPSCASFTRDVGAASLIVSFLLHVQPYEVFF